MSEPPAEYHTTTVTGDPTWHLHRDGYNALLAEHCELTDRVAHLVVRLNVLIGEVATLRAENVQLRAAVLGFTDPLIADAGLAASKAAYTQMAAKDGE